MIRHPGAIAALLALALLPGVAQAQRFRGGGSVMSPDGELYNTNSPEFRMSGGDPFLLQQLLEQKQMQQQMQSIQQMQKQQAALEKQMQDYFKKNPEAKKKYEEQQKQLLAEQQARPKPAKAKGSTAARSKAAIKGTARKPADKSPEGNKTPEAEGAKPAAPAAKPSADSKARPSPSKPTSTKPSLPASRSN